MLTSIRIQIPFAFLFLFCCARSITMGDEPQEVKKPVEMKPFQLKLKDANGKPIAGAKCTIYALRCVEEPGSHYSWPSDNAGAMKAIASDANGIAELRYPIRFGGDPDWRTTFKLSISLRHPDFIGEEIDVDHNVGEHDHTMKEGCEMEISVLDDQGDKTLDFGILMAGPGRSAEWAVTEEKTRRSRSIPSGNWQTLLVRPSSDGVHHFSGILSLRLKESQSVIRRNVPLKPGRRLVGTLSDNVKRPVEEGTVIVNCIPRPAQNSWSNEDPSILWQASTEIAQDGTFVFPSLPEGGKIQLIALARGWVIECDERKAGKQTMGMIVDIDSLEEEPIVLPMEETGDLVVTLTGPDGGPVVGANVGTWPNQLLELGGSTVLGERFDSIEGIRHQIQPVEQKKRERNYLGRFLQISDKKGKLILRDIPLGCKESFSVGHPDFRLPANADAFPYRLDKAGLTEISIQLEEIQR